VEGPATSDEIACSLDRKAIRSPPVGDPRIPAETVWQLAAGQQLGGLAKPVMSVRRDTLYGEIDFWPLAKMALDIVQDFVDLLVLVSSFQWLWKA
jgi:hypothetical protein